MRFWPVWLFAVMQMHSIVDEVGFIVEVQKRVAGQLLQQGRGRSDAVVVSRADEGLLWQPFAQSAQALIHQFRIAAAQIATPAAEHKQGVASQHLSADPVTGRSWRMPRCVQHLDFGVAQADVVAAFVQGG